MSAEKPNRRSYGSGRIVVRSDARGGETFYGIWRVDGRQVKRRLGAKRPRGGRSGLTMTDAERELRRLIDSVTPTAAAGDRLTLSR
jgi:hypothetical protein